MLANLASWERFKLWDRTATGDGAVLCCSMLLLLLGARWGFIFIQTFGLASDAGCLRYVCVPDALLYVLGPSRN